MVSSKYLVRISEKMKFFNSTQKDMDIVTVAKMIKNFIEQNPNQNYRLARRNRFAGKGKLHVLCNGYSHSQNRAGCLVLRP